MDIKKYKLIELNSKNIKKSKIYRDTSPIKVARKIYNNLCRDKKRVIFLLEEIKNKKIHGPYEGKCIKGKLTIKKMNQNGGWSFYTKK